MQALAAVPLAASFRATHAADNELVAGCDTSFMPFEFKQGSEYVGFDTDLWRAVADGAGLKWRLQPMDLNGLLPALQTRNIDVALAGTTIREDRRKVIDSLKYFALPLLAHVRIEGVTAAIVAIVINYGAYIAEIVRGALESVTKGLTDAGLSMGLPFWRILAYVSAPLAFRRAIPALRNQLVTSGHLALFGTWRRRADATRPGDDGYHRPFRIGQIYDAPLH